MPAAFDTASASRRAGTPWGQVCLPDAGGGPLPADLLDGVCGEGSVLLLRGGEELVAGGMPPASAESLHDVRQQSSGARPMAGATSVIITHGGHASEAILSRKGS